MSYRGVWRAPEPSRSSEPDIIIDENIEESQRGKKRFNQEAGPHPPKIYITNSFFGGLLSTFRGFFGVNQDEDSDNEMDETCRRQDVLNTVLTNSNRKSSASSDVLYEGAVIAPDVVCTTSKKTAQIAQPKKTLEEQDELEIVREVHRSPGQFQREQQALQEVMEAVKTADVIPIDEDSSSDSISIVSDNLNGMKSPGPDDSISRQNTPSRLREDFQTPKDTWSRRRPSKQKDIPRVSMTPINRERLNRLTKQNKTPTSTYHTPTKEIESIPDSSLAAYNTLLTELSTVRRIAAGSGRKHTRYPQSLARPSELVIRAKAALRKFQSRQPSEILILEDESRSTTSGEVIETGSSRCTSETPSVSSYNSSTREKVDDLIARHSVDGIKVQEKLKDFDKYRIDRKYDKMKEKELTETSKQIRVFRDLHDIDLVEEIREKLYLTGIRRPLPKKKASEEFPELPLEAKALCDRAWSHGGNKEEVFVEGFNTKITRKDLLTLYPGKWLNDEVITFFLNLVVERSQLDSNLPKVYAFNTFFYVNLSTKGFASVKRWTRKVDIFSYEILLIPVHVNGVHWCMAVVDLGQKSIDYFDPMHHDDNGALSYLRDYLTSESQDKKKVDYDFTGWTFRERPDCPRQKNGFDCGVFSTHFAEYCARRAPLTFSQQHMDYFRKRMVYELVQKKLM